MSLLEQSVTSASRCPFTGIPYHFVIASEAPAILPLDNLQLKESVFSLKNALSIASQTEATLQQLSNPTLAGIFLLLYSSKQLLVYKAPAPLINDMLSTSEQTTLIKAIRLFPQINKANLNAIPQRDLDPSVYANSNEANFEDYMKDFVELVEDAIKIKTIDNPVNAAMVRIRGSWTPPVLGKNEIPAWTKSDHEISFAKEYHQARIVAKNALARTKIALIQIGYNKLANVLSTAVSGDTLLTASTEVRNKLYERLTDCYAELPEDYHSQIDRILAFITLSHDRDIDAVKRLNLGLDNASHSFVSEKPKLTLAERLAKAKEQTESAGK